MPTPIVFNGTTYNIPLAGELNWSSLSNFLIDVGTNASTSTVQKQNIRVALATPVTVIAASDYAVFTALSSPGAVAVTLPAGVQGQIFVIGDGLGDAHTNNITITPSAGQTINGSATLVLNHDRQVAVLQYHAATTDWKVHVVTIPPGTLVDADIAAAAAIARSKVAAGSANHVVINDGAGLLSSEAILAETRGGTGVNSTAVFPTSGNVTTDANTQTLTNKSYDAAGTGNVLSNVANTNVASGAAIARSKLASGSANQVVINDGAGAFSSEAFLAGSRGGTGISSTATFPSSGVVVTESGTETLTNKTLTSPQIGTDAALLAQAPLKFFPPTGTDYIGLEAPDTLAATTTFKLPDADGTASQVLVTDGSANLSWASVGTTSLAQDNVNIGDAGNSQQPTNTDFLGAIKASTSTATVTISNGSPGMITWVANGFIRGDTVYFTTTGALPTGLSPNTKYFVVDTSGPDDFSVALVAGDTAINTSSAGSGVHTGHAGGLTISPGVARPYIVVDTGNGVGTTLGRVRRWSVIRQPQQGFPEFAYADSAANGGTFTINTPGVYQVEYCDRFDVGAGNVAIMINSDDPPQTDNSDNELAISSITTPSSWTCLSGTAYLRAGDVIRVTVDSATYSTSSSVKIRITKLF